MSAEPMHDESTQPARRGAYVPYLVALALLILPSAIVFLMQHRRDDHQAARAPSTYSTPAPSEAKEALNSAAGLGEEHAKAQDVENRLRSAEKALRDREEKLRAEEALVKKREAELQQANVRADKEAEELEKKRRMARIQADQEKLNKAAKEQEAKIRAARWKAAQDAAKQLPTSQQPAIDSQPSGKRFILLWSRDGSFLKLTDGTYWTVNSHDQVIVAGLSGTSGSIGVTIQGNRMVLSNGQAISVEPANNKSGKKYIVLAAKDGAFLRLSDGSYWSVHPNDQVTVAGLTDAQGISVTTQTNRMYLSNGAAITVEPAAK